jgi:hypothetical protein
MTRTLIPSDTTVAYEELAGSPRERLTESGFHATRLLKCAWADRIELCSQLLGSVQAAAGRAVHVLPARYPHMPRARAVAAAAEPFDTLVTAAAGDPQTADYQCARVTVHYATQSFDTEPQEQAAEPFVTETLQPTAEFITLAALDLFWSNPPGSGGMALDDHEAPGKLIRGLDWGYTRHFAPRVPPAAFELIGRVNADVVVSRTLGHSFDPGTLLYNPPAIRRVTTGAAAVAWELAYRFSFRPQGWNRAWRTATAAFEPLYTHGGPYAIYPDADFAPLLE